MDKIQQQKILETALSTEGSLGQLALGAFGLRAWRKMRDIEATKKEQKTNGKTK